MNCQVFAHQEVAVKKLSNFNDYIKQKKNLKLGLFNFYRRDERFAIGNLIKISEMNYCKMILLLVVGFLFLGYKTCIIKCRPTIKLLKGILWKI